MYVTIRLSSILNHYLLHTAHFTGHNKAKDRPTTDVQHIHPKERHYRFDHSPNTFVFITYILFGTVTFLKKNYNMQDFFFLQSFIQNNVEEIYTVILYFHIFRVKCNYLNTDIFKILLYQGYQ